MSNNENERKLYRLNYCERYAVMHIEWKWRKS